MKNDHSRVTFFCSIYTCANNLFPKSLFLSYMFIKTKESRTKSSWTKFKSLLNQEHFSHILCSSPPADTDRGGEVFPKTWLRDWYLKCQIGRDHFALLNSADWKVTTFLNINPKSCKIQPALLLYDVFEISHFCNPRL